MPGGKTHLRIELGLLGLMSAGGAVLWWQGTIGEKELGAFLGAYLFSSLFLSPDLDLWESRATRRWWIGRILWYPYSKVFRHRRASHHLILGPLTRIVYLGGLVLLGAWGWSRITHQRLLLPSLRTEILLPIIIGLYIPNQVHIMTDRIWSKFRVLRHRH